MTAKPVNHDIDFFVSAFLQSMINEAGEQNLCFECICKSVLLSMVATAYENNNRDPVKLADLLATCMAATMSAARHGGTDELIPSTKAKCH